MLAFSSLIASILISLPLGIQAAIKRGKPTDQAIRILSLVGLSFPNFWLALMLVLLLSITFRCCRRRAGAARPAWCCRR